MPVSLGQGRRNEARPSARDAASEIAIARAGRRAGDRACRNWAPAVLRDLRPLWLACVAALAAASPVQAQKTDVVVLKRGDAITGEVRELNHASLTYKTDDMGTVNIEWEKIAHVTSQHFFEVELTSGDKHYGRLAASDIPGELLVILTDTLTFDMRRVVYMVRIKSSLWRRIDGYVDFGFDFVKANRVRRLNMAFEVAYRGTHWSSRLAGTSYFQRQEGTVDVSRNEYSLYIARLLSGRWNVLVGAGAAENSELGLDLRTTLGAGAIYDAMATNLHALSLIGALAYARENFTTGTEGQNTVQLELTADYALYKLQTPKADITGGLSVIPILNDLGRVRIDFDSRVAYELFKDFTVSLRFYDNFDSRQPATATSQNDYGLTFSFGLKF